MNFFWNLNSENLKKKLFSHWNFFYSKVKNIFLMFWPLLTLMRAIFLTTQLLTWIIHRNNCLIWNHIKIGNRLSGNVISENSIMKGKGTGSLVKCTYLLPNLKNIWQTYNFLLISLALFKFYKLFWWISKGQLCRPAILDIFKQQLFFLPCLW